jgi:transcriptional regulator with XRE-family HTH domain
MAARAEDESLVAGSASAPAPAHSGAGQVERLVRARLRRLRDERGLTLAEVASAAGIATSTLSRLETGRRRLALAHVAPLADALGVTTDELLATPSTGAPPAPRSPWTTRDGVTFVPLTGEAPADGRHVNKLLLPPGLREPAPRTHPGHEQLRVLSGRLRLVLGSEDHVLTPGAAIEFSTWLPHWTGVVEEPVELLAVFDERG